MIKLVVSALCVLAILGSVQLNAQNVTTWHYDINRTGWQPNETTLNQSNVNQTQFGLLWQWPVTGAVFAQPLAVKLQQSVGTCGSPCSLVFIATEQNMLYAFNAASSSPTPVWSLSLGTPVNCSSLPTGVADFAPCDGVDGTPPGAMGGVVGPYGGVTGTPVIDTITNPTAPTLYVVAPVVTGGAPPISYYPFAVNIATTNHTTVPSIPISGSATGNPPPNASTTGKCTSDYPTQGSITFNYNHIQRSGLLLMPNGQVYVAFAPAGHEVINGWMFGYSFNGSSLTQTARFSSTPWGTGGGSWGSGAGPASDGTYIYAATGNGTTFDPVNQTIPSDIGDSLLKLLPSGLAVVDFYAPPDAGYARCHNDIDFSSGGVLVVPSTFTYTQNVDNCANGCNVVVNADKESKLYVTNQASLGKFISSGGNNIQTVLTPCLGGPPGCNQNPSTQGYWASPAYWYDGTNSWLYYSPMADGDQGAAPYPVYAYQLATSGPSGPISQTATASTAAPDLFCAKSPTPSVSSNPQRPDHNGHCVGD
jgi:hypothetical protein